MNEIGVASVINYVHAVGDWFESDLGSYRFAMLPLSFEGIAAAGALRPTARTAQATNLLAHMERACAAPLDSGDGRFAAALRIETRIVGSGSTDAMPIKFAAGPDAVKVELTEEEFRRRWPHEHKKWCAYQKANSGAFRKQRVSCPCKRSFAAMPGSLKIGGSASMIPNQN